MTEWEGAEICFYTNGESHSFSLSDVQFAVIVKMLGLQMNRNDEISCFSDDTLKQFLTMKGNPLKLCPIE